MRVEVRDVTQSYGAERALDDVTLEAASGELLVVLGPSGSGKSTLLHLVAGLVPLERGSVLLDGRDVASVPARERGTPLVQQRHALFPHLSVLDNVAFGLRMQGVPRAEREARAREALRDVRLEGLDARYPAELSGGQAQRVAIARALVTRPSLLLLDEPFSSLDAALRAQMQALLLDLHRAKGLTTIFVTHDQREALRLGDRIAVLMRGRLRQIGPAREVYDCPASADVARFLGLTNIVPARIRQGRIHIDGVGAFPLPAGVEVAEGARVDAAFRPEGVSLRPPEEDVGIPTRIAEIHDHGQTVNYSLHLHSGRIEVTTLGPPRYAVGDDVRLVFDSPPWVLPDPATPPGSHGSTERLKGTPRTEAP